MPRNQSKSNLPKISIVVPSYNKVEYIGKTLESIVLQKYSNLEVFIQDGGSNDGTVDVIKKYAKRHPKIFNWVSKKDKGQLAAINQGLKKTQGELLTFINADDVYKKGALLKIARTYNKHPDSLWITGFGDIIDQRGKVFSGFVTNYKNQLLKLNSYNLLLAVNYITQPATFLTRDAYLKYGPFCGTVADTKNYIMEYDLWLKLAKVKMPLVIDQTLASFRLTTNNISATAFNQLLKIDNQITKRYTNNSLILLVHSLHNWARVILINLLKHDKILAK